MLSNRGADQYLNGRDVALAMGGVGCVCSKVGGRGVVNFTAPDSAAPQHEHDKQTVFNLNVYLGFGDDVLVT